MRTFENCVNIKHPDFVALQNKYGYYAAAQLTRLNNMYIPSLKEAETSIEKYRKQKYDDLNSYLSNSPFIESQALLKYLAPYVTVTGYNPGTVKSDGTKVYKNGKLQPSESPEVRAQNLARLKSIQNRLLEQGIDLFTIERFPTSSNYHVKFNQNTIDKLNSEKSKQIDDKIAKSEGTQSILFQTSNVDNPNIKEAIEWINKIFPNANLELTQELINGIAKGSYNTITDLITLSEKYANKQTAKHEVGHYAWGKLSKNKQEELLNEGSKLFNIPRGKSTATIRYSQAQQNEINYAFKSVDILSSDKAKQVFSKGEKANWDLNKILTELQIPKEQKQLILGSNKTDREDIITDLLDNYSYIVEINTAKAEPFTDRSEINTYVYNNEEYIDAGFGYFKNGDIEISEQEYNNAVKNGKRKFKEKPIQNTQHYSNLTVNEDFYKNNPDWEYKEQRITTPLITPSIKGHAQFAEANDIGWFRAWYNKKTGEVHVIEIQSDLFQKGRNKEKLVDKPLNFDDILSGNLNEQDNLKEENKENKFLQLLNKDNNWVTFFIKSIIQDTAKQTITEVQESDVEAKVKELEKDGLLEIDCKGKLKAEKGLQTNFTKGGEWKLIKDLKGYPTHKEGGVDLTIGKDGVRIKNGNAEFTARHGLVIPKN